MLGILQHWVMKWCTGSSIIWEIPVGGGSQDIVRSVIGSGQRIT